MFYSSNIIFAVCFIFILMKVCIQKTKQRYCCRLDFYSFTKKVLYHRYFPDDFVEAFRGTLSDCFSLFIIKNMFTRLTKQTNTYQANARSVKNLLDLSIRFLTQDRWTFVFYTETQYQNMYLSVLEKLPVLKTHRKICLIKEQF